MRCGTSTGNTNGVTVAVGQRVDHYEAIHEVLQDRFALHCSAMIEDVRTVRPGTVVVAVPLSTKHCLLPICPSANHAILSQSRCCLACPQVCTGLLDVPSDALE